MPDHDPHKPVKQGLIGRFLGRSCSSPRAGSPLHKSFRTDFCSACSWSPQRWRTAACHSQRRQLRCSLPPRSFPPPTAAVPSFTLSPLPLVLPPVREEVWFISFLFAALGSMFASCCRRSLPQPAGSSCFLFPHSCLLDTLQQTQPPPRNTIQGDIQRVDQSLDLFFCLCSLCKGGIKSFSGTGCAMPSLCWSKRGSL